VKAAHKHPSGLPRCGVEGLVEPAESVEVVALLGDPRSTFVVASPGEPLHWVAIRDRYDFWKVEVKPHGVVVALTG
jgi:hypothetical protein